MNDDPTEDELLTRSREMATAERYAALDARPETAPMKPSELGLYVCVAEGGCLHSPLRTIESDGLWVKGKRNVSSAHRDCHEKKGNVP